MAIGLIFILILIGIVEWILEKKIYNFLTAYCFFWSIIVFLANLKLFDMYEYSNKGYELILIGSLGFAIGYWIFRFWINNKKFKVNMNNKILNDNNLNKKYVYLLVYIALVFYTYVTLKVLLFFKDGYSYYLIRRMYQGYADMPFFNSKLEVYFSSYIAIPIIYVLCPLFIIEVFKKNKDFRLLILMTLTLVLYLFSSASRFIVLNIVFQFIFIALFLNKKIPKKILKRVKIAVVALLGVIILVTVLRENKPTYNSSYDWGILKSTYSYFSVSVPLLTYWSEYINSIGYFGKGLVTFRAPLSLITLLLLHPLGIEFNSLTEAINLVNQTDIFIPIFPKHTYNAFASIFYYFYVDFREIGVFIGCMFFGAICGFIFKKLVINPNNRNLLFSLLIIQALFKSMVRWEFYTSGYFIAFIIALFIYNERKKIRIKL